MKDLNDVVAAVMQVLADNGQPATDETQSRPAVFEPLKVIEQFPVWWESGAGDKYIIQDGENGSSSFHEWNETKLVKKLRTLYVQVKQRKGETLSEIDQTLLYVMQDRRLDLVLDALPGYKSGIHDYGGKQILVRTSPRLLEAKHGDWSTIKKLIDGCLDWSDSEDGGSNQSQYFHAWCKVGAESLYTAQSGNFQAGQCCIFAGPRNCGKSRIQHWIITGIFGGRSADPGPYLFGDTDFNGEWLEGEHLLMEDPASSTSIKDRVFFGERLKQTVISDKKRIHTKRKTALNLEPFYRMSISVNDDPDKIRVLPLLTPDMKDKVHLFLVRRSPMPMSTQTLDERIAFKSQIASELPAYLWWLLHEFAIPEDIREERMGVTSWRHPTIEREMFDDSPGAELLQLIDAARWEGRYLWQLESASTVSGIWEDTSLELETRLMNSTVSKEAERLIKHHKLDRLLSRLKEDEPDRVIQHRTATARHWMISGI